MKAKHFKKLRNQVSYYEVFETKGLFGDFTSRDRGKCILARSHEDALNRFLRIQERKYKERSIYYGVDLETTSNWGVLKIIDNKGYKKYYR